ncbi:hypothetical protein Slin15195_G062050 [Septoria linicola]|uniref:Uncharacterized protein n=1 Tax=Septoria linicola TaxID=215465 RepID=A0A9Q9AYC4_9PEZI|nr:hypothetical protein Slin14017_G077860 [Septoria linicola]USW52886.1 hypothetical protein Slin15195_G062050 [Septoria linicola]
MADPQPVHDTLSSKYSDLLTDDEAYEIIRHFEGVPLKPGCQVMWTGVPRDCVQDWADDRNLQTLTTAMGPSMNKDSPLCKRRSKSPGEWTRYVMGASALFAECLPKGHIVTLITRPPPQRFNPSGCSTYQQLEQPALQRDVSGLAVSSIEIVHFTVEGAQNSAYQYWPEDQEVRWTQYHKSKDISAHLTQRTPAPNKCQVSSPRIQKRGRSNTTIASSGTFSSLLSFEAILAICLLQPRLGPGRPWTERDERIQGVAWKDKGKKRWESSVPRAEDTQAASMMALPIGPGGVESLRRRIKQKENVAKRSGKNKQSSCNNRETKKNIQKQQKPSQKQQSTSQKQQSTPPKQVKKVKKKKKKKKNDVNQGCKEQTQKKKKKSKRTKKMKKQHETSTLKGGLLSRYILS